jgi:hypothetical protein
MKGDGRIFRPDAGPEGDRLRLVYDGELRGRLQIEKRIGTDAYETLAEIECDVFLYVKGALDDPPGCIVEISGISERGSTEITLRLKGEPA